MSAFASQPASSALYDCPPAFSLAQQNNQQQQSHLYSDVPVAPLAAALPISNQGVATAARTTTATTVIDENRPYCRALYDFRGECSGELSLSAGELLYLTKRVNDEWLEGQSQVGGQCGIFPAGFVEIVVPLPEDAIGPNQGQNAVALHANKLITAANNEEEAIGFASVLYDFDSRFPDELGVKAGDSVLLVAIVDAEWAKCRDPLNGRVGIVPQGFLHIFLDAPAAAADDDLTASRNGEHSTMSNDATFTSPLAMGSSDWTSSETPFPSIYPSLTQTTILRTPSTNSVINRDRWSQLTAAADPWDTFAGGTGTPAAMTAFGQQQPAPPRPPPPKMPTAIAKSSESLTRQPNKSTSSSSSFATKKIGKAMLAKPAKKASTSSTSSASAAAMAGGGRRLSQPTIGEAIGWDNRGATTNSFSDAEEADESLIGALVSSSAGAAGQSAFMSSMANPHIHSAVLNQHQQISSSLNLNTSAAAQSGTKAKVVADLLNTERTYLFDLDCWETCIKESPKLSADDKKALTNGYSVLKQLSQSLITALEAQKDLPTGDHTFGEVFMTLRDHFYTAFANHFRYVEQISAFVENEEDQQLQRALHDCLQAMRQRGSNVFDVPTAVARPIQRCLKYPLYVGELLKNTPINHPDHPKLMEALRQLVNLASKMNECKRRKELIRKYQAAEQLTLADRISRINMHSLVKKSNRLKYRINRTMGFGTVKDTEFDYLVQLMEEAERRLCKFLYCTQLYKKHIEIGVKKHEDSYKGVCQVQEEQMVKAFAQMFRRVDEICRKHLQAVDQEVILEGKKLVRSELAKLIHKRFDKLADFETSKTTNKNPDEVEMRRNEFEALNNQIKAQLPRLISTINKRVLQLIQRVNELDSQFRGRMDEWFAKERPEKVRHCLPNAQPFRAYLSLSLKHTIIELDKIAAHLYQRQANDEGGGALAVARKKSLRLSLKAKPGNSNRKSTRTTTNFGGIADNRRPQTLKERDALVKICRAQQQWAQLRRVQRDWQSGELVLRAGDVLWVKAHRQDGFSVCDNAVSIGLVPIELLLSFDPLTESAPTASVNGAGGDGSFSNQLYCSPSADVVESANNKQQQLDYYSNSSQNWLNQQLKSSGQNQPTITNAVSMAPSLGSHNQQKTTTEQQSQLQKKCVPQGDDLIDLEENLIDLSSPAKTAKSDAVAAGGQQKQPPPPPPTFSTSPMDFPLLDYEQEPSCRMSVLSSGWQPKSAAAETTFHRQLDDPFDELFKAAMQITRLESPLVPEIPDRPNTAASSGANSAWSLPTDELPPATSAAYSNAFDLPLSSSSIERPKPSSSGAAAAAVGAIQPIRIAPPPPNQKKRTTPTPTSNLVVDHLASPAAPSPQQQAAPMMSLLSSGCPSAPYYSLPPIVAQPTAVQWPMTTSSSSATLAYCAFDFEPIHSGSGQLAVKQGNLLEVLRQTDDGGNSQWWLVKRGSDGSQGFVPANYLSLNNTRV